MDFLVIGAMKSGTTTLYEDLRHHPNLLLAEKESAGLFRYDMDSAGGRRSYLDLARRGCQKNALVGEVATTYSMWPHQGNAAELAAKACPQAKVIYILREPVARIVSHHFHDYSSGLLDVGIDEAILSDSRFVDYSCYGTQLSLWLECFPPESIRILRFEDYIRDRESAMAHLFEFIGIGRADQPLDDSRVYNASAGKPVAVGRWAKVSHSSGYRRAIRPFLPERLRRGLTRALLPSAPPRPAAPSAATVQWLVDRLRPEMSEIEAFTRSRVTWNLDEVVQAASRAL